MEQAMRTVPDKTVFEVPNPVLRARVLSNSMGLRYRPGPPGSPLEVSRRFFTKARDILGHPWIPKRISFPDMQVP